MKSGKRIFKAVVVAKTPEKSVRRLSNGSLRSLMLHALTFKSSDIGQEMLATCMAELTRRFLKTKNILP